MNRYQLSALLRAGLVDASVLLDRADTIDRPGAVRRRVAGRIARCVRDAQIENADPA
jgi:hypothetical protein